MSDDAGVGQETMHVYLSELSHFLRIEPGEAVSEVLPLAKDGNPGEPALKTSKTDLPEERWVVGCGWPQSLLVVLG